MYEENLFGGRASIEQDLNCIIYCSTYASCLCADCIMAVSKIINSEEQSTLCTLSLVLGTLLAVLRLKLYTHTTLDPHRQRPAERRPVAL